MEAQPAQSSRPKSRGRPYGAPRINPRPPVDALEAAILGLEPVPTSAAEFAGRLDFLCDSCGHTIATVGTKEKKFRRLVCRLTLNCPKCGAAKSCGVIAFADPMITAVAEWHMRDGKPAVRMLEVAG